MNNVGKVLSVSRGHVPRHIWYLCMITSDVAKTLPTNKRTSIMI